jgi:hypothetical protein
MTSDDAIMEFAPVAVAAGRRGNGYQRLIEWVSFHRTVARRIAMTDDAAVSCRHPVAVALRTRRYRNEATAARSYSIPNRSITSYEREYMRYYGRKKYHRSRRD